MSRNDTPRLQSCIGILDLYEKQLCESLREGERSQEPHAVILLRAFGFGRITLNGMIAVVESNGNCGGCAATLCRPYYELTTRLLWASREPDGWRRLELMWERQNRAYCQEAVNFPDAGPFPQAVLDRANESLGRAAADDLKSAPNMERTLTDIESRDNDDGVPGKWAAQQYTGLWRGMSMSVHSHISIVVQASELLQKMGTGAAVVATIALLRAMAIGTSPDGGSLNKTNIAIMNQMTGLIPGTDE